MGYELFCVMALYYNKRDVLRFDPLQMVILMFSMLSKITIVSCNSSFKICFKVCVPLILKPQLEYFYNYCVGGTLTVLHY
jgi:hypothetical protein